MQIEGVPEGFELVRIGTPELLEFYIDETGEALRATGTREAYPSRGMPIIRKIEKPKRYRPFANAEEFKPFRDRWTYHPVYPDKLFRSTAYNDKGVFDGRVKHTYTDLLEAGTLFEDGTPFGIEVTE